MTTALENKDGAITEQQSAEAVRCFFNQHDYTGKRLLLIAVSYTHLRAHET